jgi:hypothetical protein
MIVNSSESFFKDLSNIKNIEVFDEIESLFDFAEKCSSPDAIPGFKSLETHPGMPGLNRRRLLTTTFPESRN